MLLLSITGKLTAAELNFEDTKEHPRLILTKNNLEDFRNKAKKENQHLFNQSIQLANEFSQRPIIQFKNAHNSYREIGDGMPVLGLVYKINGDKKYVTTAEEWISSMLKTESWEGSQNLGRSSWIVGLCFLYDWMFDALDEELKNQMIKRLVKEAQIVVETASYTRALSNHLLIETTAVGMVGLLLPNDNPDKQEFLGQADLWAQYIIKHAPLDGSWGEGVQYWQYGTGYFLRFLEAAKISGYKNYYDDYDWLRKTGYFPIYFSLPEKLTKVINFSDCTTDRYLPAFLFYLPAKIYRNRYFQDFGEKVQSGAPHKFSWLDFLFYDASLSPKDFTSLPLFHHFEDHGFVSMRSGWEEGATVVGFRCGAAPGHNNQSHPERIQNKVFGPGHQQPDINSFVLFAQNEWLAIDPGYTRKKETQNHNTILVNGYGQAGAGGKWLDYMEFESRDPAPKILYAKSNAVMDYIIGDAGNIYVDEAEVEYFRRHLVFLKPDILVILDDIRTSQKSTVNWLLQLNEIAKVEQQGKNFRINKNDVEFWIHPISPENVKSTFKSRNLDASDVHGSSDKDGGILKSIQLSKEAEKLQFLVVLTISDKSNKEAPSVHFNNNKLVIQNNSREKVLHYNYMETEIDKPLLSISQ